MTEQLAFEDLANLHRICTEFINVGMYNNATARYKINDTNDFDAVLAEMRKGCAHLTIKRDVNAKVIVEVYNESQDCDYYLYIFLTETDDDKLLITLSVDSDIVP
jgi:hypothetical protein